MTLQHDEEELLMDDPRVDPPTEGDEPDVSEPVDPLEGLMDPEDGENSPASDTQAPPPG